jgi:hypothetical protein
MYKFTIEGCEIKTAYDLYTLYNEWLQDITDDAKECDYEYDPNEEPNYVIEAIRDNYKELFDKVEHNNYEHAEDFEAACRDLLQDYYVTWPCKNEN